IRAPLSPPFALRPSPLALRPSPLPPAPAATPERWRRGRRRFARGSGGGRGEGTGRASLPHVDELAGVEEDPAEVLHAVRLCQLDGAACLRLGRWAAEGKAVGEADLGRCILARFLPEALRHAVRLAK